MPELIEDLNSEQPDVQRYLDIVRRRHLHLLIPFFLTWLLVWGLSWILPPMYKSSTQILVEQPTMPSNYVAPNVNEDLQARLQSITQQILSSTRLAMIIEKLNLYPDGGSMDDRVEGMRKDIKIGLVKDTRNNEITAFTVAFSARSPQVAQQVTTELTNLFISENLKVRQQQSQGTTKFIQDQLEVARVQLAEQEAKLKSFEGAHVGILPSQQTSNLQILGGLQNQLQNEQDALTQTKQQRIYLQAMIDQARAARGALRPDGTAPLGLPEVNQQLERLRAQLVDLSSRYTDQYPDVLKIKDQIAKTEHLKQELLAAPKKPVDETAESREAEGPAANSPLAQLQGQFKVNQAEIANHEHRIDELQQRIGEYQGRLNAAPTTEQELAEVSRGYDQSKQIYDELLKKKNESEMATSMEQLQQGQHFSIIDPPTLPQKPDFPNRLKFCGIGLALGLVLGGIVAAIFEFVDDRVHNESDLRAMLNLTILSEVPEVVHPSDEAKKTRRQVFSWVATAIAVLTILAGTTISILNS